jgi:hypothetical protein
MLPCSEYGGAAPLRNAWKLRQARLFIALATVRPYRHHRGADLGAELE